MAGVELATAYISIVPEGSRIAPEVRKQFGQVGAEATRAGKTSGKKFGGAFSGGLKLLGGAALGGAALSFLKDAISGASDLNESTTKITAIFGKADGAVQAFASKGAKSLGQTKLEVLDAAASFGTFGKAAGLQGPKLATFSTGLAGLSTDLASFFNTDPSQATEAIGAALRGESEPIRQYGVLLDDATLKAEALRLGLLKPVKDKSKILSAQVAVTSAQQKYNESLKKNGADSLVTLQAQAKLGSAQTTLQKATEGSIGPLTQQQKVLAAQSSIYKQTKDAQGDFARTSGGLANQQRILKAQFSDVRSELGAKLLPVAVKVVSATSDLIAEFQNGTGAGGQIRDVLEDIVGVGKGVLKFFKGIPGPVKKLAVEAGIAYFVLGRLSTGLAIAGTRIAYMGSVAVATATGTRSIVPAANAAGVGLRNLAGAGGMLALVDAGNRSSKAMGGLEGAIGGALTGFALSGGNPFGALIGGVGGGLLGVFSSGRKASSGIDKTAQSAKSAATPLQDYASSLDETAKATRKLNVETALKNLTDSGALANARKVGISGDTLVKATLGDAKATEQVIRANQRAIDTYGKSGLVIDKRTGRIRIASDAEKEAAAAAKRLSVQLGVNADKFKADSLAASQAALDAGRYAKVFPGIPKKIATKIAAPGLDKAESGVVTLNKKYGLTPKQIQTVLKAEQVPQTLANIRAVLGAANRLDGKVVRVTIATKTTNATVAEGKLPPFPGGRDGDPLTPYPRVLGGPVSKGQPYIVGEKRPELFIPNQAGRIQPRVQSASISAAGSAVARTMILRVDGHDFRAYVEQAADSRVDSAAALRGETDRAL